MPTPKPSQPTTQQALDSVLETVAWGGRRADSVAFTGSDPILPCNFRLATAGAAVGRA